MKKENLYVSPEVEVLNVMVEKGFAATTVPGVDKDLVPEVPEDF